MERERKILFRGKRTDNGEWVYGDLIHYDDEPSIHTKASYGLYKHERVDPSTVGQFTGLYDCKGRRAYEGDIVHDDFHNNYGVVSFGDYASPMSAQFTHNIGFYIEWKKGNTKDFMRKDLGYWLIETHFTEIVGNVCDNPEMLG